MAYPLILLPGLLCDERVWTHPCQSFAGRIDCIVPDYGMCDSIESMAQQVLSGIASEQFCLAGHSMGGRVALEIFRLAPARVKRLALLDTGYQSLAEGEAGEREWAGRMTLLNMAQEKGMHQMGSAWIPGMVHHMAPGSIVYEDILEMIARSTPEKFAAQIRALLGRPDASSLLPRIGVPTLIACGRQDQWSPLSRHEAMQREIPGARLRVIENSGHMSTMEQPEAVTTALAEWLDWEPAGGGANA